MSNYYNMPKLPTENSPKVEIFVEPSRLSGLKLPTYVTILTCRYRVTAASAWWNRKARVAACS